MARSALLIALVTVALAIPAHAYVIPADNCADPVTYVTPDDLTVDPAQPQVGQTVTYTYGGDPAYVKPGTMVFTVELPSGDKTQLRPATADGQSVQYTPPYHGPYNVTATWQGKNCNDPEQYGDGSAAVNHQVVDPPSGPTKQPGTNPVPPGTHIGDDGKPTTQQNLDQSMGAKAVPGFVKQFGIKAAHKLPSNCRNAGVVHDRALNVSPPGKPNPHGVWIGYGPNTARVSCPQVFAFHKPLSLIRSLLVGHMKGYVRFGDRGDTGSLRVGSRSVTVIRVISGQGGYSDFVWRQAGVTYDVEVLAKNGVPKLGGTSIKTIIGSFS